MLNKLRCLLYQEGGLQSNTGAVREDRLQCKSCTLLEAEGGLQRQSHLVQKSELRKKPTVMRDQHRQSVQ